MRQLVPWTVLALLLAFVGVASARSRHVTPTVKRCGSGCSVTLPIQNHDGYDTVHAWAVPTSARGQVNRANILTPQSGIPGAQYLGTLRLQAVPGSTSVLEGQIHYSGGEFAAGQPMYIYTGFTSNNNPSAHIWGVSDGPAFNQP